MGDWTACGGDIRMFTLPLTLAIRKQEINEALSLLTTGSAVGAETAFGSFSG